MIEQKPYRLLVVDDEPLARLRIRSFDLATRGYAIAGEAENGEQAWRMIERLRPDIVIADIGMPVLNGLDLLKRINGLPVPPRVILLTCFEDFDKVQTAMRHGAADYLTKLLLSETELIACLDRAVEDIRKARMQQQWTLRQLLQDLLLSGRTAPSDELVREMAAFKQFRLGLLRFPSTARLNVVQLTDTYERNASPNYSFLIRLAEPIWAILFASTEPNGGADFHAWIMDALKRGFEVAHVDGLQPLQVLTEAKYKLNQLPEALDACRRLLDLAFFEPKGTVVVRDSVESGAFSTNAPAKEACAEVKKALDMGNACVVEAALESWLSEVILRHKPGFEQLRHASFELGSCFHEDMVVESDRGIVSVREWIPAAVERCEHASDLSTMLRQLVDNLSSKALPVHRFRHEIRMAIGYIRTHYQEDLDLVTVARHVNLSPSWFGTLFRNQTGSGFLDFLQDYRLEQARSMMAMSNLKIYEISTLVGITNPRYFSRLFSDKYRMSPQDYRSKARGKLLG